MHNKHSGLAACGHSRLGNRNEQSAKLTHVNINNSWCSDTMGRALDLRSTGREFKSHSGQKLGQVVHTCVPLSPSSITWYWPRGGDALQLGR